MQEASRLRSLCVFCGASTGAGPQFRDQTARLGRLLAEAGVTLVYGGGNIGLMGILAESVIAAGGKVIGVIPEHLRSVELPFREASEMIVVDSMHSRKQKMFDLADAFCVLPGGLGTLDETFEILTWRQLRLHDKPVVLVNVDGYWNAWLDLVEGIIANGFAQPTVENLFTVVETADEVLAAAEGRMIAVPVSDSRLF
jgi:hypothetical protein